MNRAFLLTGGNIGERWQNLEVAMQWIEKLAGTVLKISSAYETAAWGLKDQEPFLNQVLLISTPLTPGEILHTISDIEQKMGRKRMEKMGPRIIDIDILFYNTEIISLPDLIVPHPQIQHRRFVLTPLNEVAPRFIHPVLNKTVNELLLACTDELKVQRL